MLNAAHQFSIICLVFTIGIGFDFACVNFICYSFGSIELSSSKLYDPWLKCFVKFFFPPKKSHERTNEKETLDIGLRPKQNDNNGDIIISYFCVSKCFTRFCFLVIFSLKIYSFFIENLIWNY